MRGNQVFVWSDLSRGQPTYTIEVPGTILDLSVSGTVVAVGMQDEGLWLIDTGTGIILNKLYPGESRLGLAVSADGSLLYSTCGDLYVADIQTGEHRAKLKNVCGPLCVDPTGRYLAGTSRTNRKNIVLIRTADLVKLKEFAGHSTGIVNYINDISFSFDGEYLVSCGEDNTVRIWPTAVDT